MPGEIVEDTAPTNGVDTVHTRRSSRRKAPVNYDLRNHVPKRTGGEAEGSSDLIDVSATKRTSSRPAKRTQKSSESSIYKSSNGGSLVPKPGKDAATIRENLTQILVDNTRKIDELFQLVNYTSLVSFDPLHIHRESSIYEELYKEHDLWAMAKDASQEDDDNISRRRTARRAPAVHPLQNELNAQVKQILEPVPERAPSTPSASKKSRRAEVVDSDDEPDQVEVSSSRSRKRGRTVPVEKKSVPSTPQSKKKSSSRSSNKRSHTKARIESASEAASEVESEESESDEEEEDSDDDEVFDQPIAEEYKHVRKIRAVVRQPGPVVTDKSHVTAPKFESLTAFLESYKSLDEDMSLEEYDKYLEGQNELVGKIRGAIKSRTLRIDFEENVDRTYWNQREELTMIKPALRTAPYKDPFKIFALPTHHDHLVAQGTHMAKLFQDNRRARTARCKRIAQMIDTHFKRKSMSKDRERKEFEAKMTRMAKETARMVKRKWLQAEKAWKILEDRRKEQERVQRGKQHLSEMLEHSTQLLEQQMTNRSNSTTRQATPASDDNLENSDDETGSDHADSDDNLSSSSEDSDDEVDSSKPNGDLKEEEEEEDDSKLSVEALREKYKHLQEKEEAEKAKLGQAGGSLAELYNGEDIKVEDVDISKYTEITEEEKAAIANEDPHNSVLDSDSDDDSLSSDLASDEASSEAEESGSDSDVSQDTKTPTLASLFGGGVAEDSDDESVYSEDNEVKSETSISTPEDENSKDKVTPASKESDEMTNEQVNSVPDVPTPFLLRGQLRVYQKQGLNWLAGLYNNNTNGILADEMGLGKTIQTISLISYLACEKQIWGPHLIVVPTSVMLNWEMEFKRFAPGFKVLTYYGSPQQRKEKRKGWNTPDQFHVCITSYQLVVHDQHAFRRKKWKYMILDEAHNIKNFRSQRWQALLNFNTDHRLLLTGTPLQNSIMELWSLLYFLMPSTKANQSMPAGFANLQDFQQWFGRPVDKIVEGGGTSAEADQETKNTVSKLHQVLRPYLLRRLKADVEKQMPAKYEHIVYCRLSKRQRFLYDDFMSRAQTKETLASGNFLSIINCLMQLRKVCNHPDLFEVRPIVTSLAMPRSVASDFTLKELIVRKRLDSGNRPLDLDVINWKFTNNEHLTTCNADSFKALNGAPLLEKESEKLEKVLANEISSDYDNLEHYYDYAKYREQEEALAHTKHTIYLNNLRCARAPIYGRNVLEMVTLEKPTYEADALEDIIKPLETRALMMRDTIEKYAFVTPAVVANDMKYTAITPDLSQQLIANTASLPNPFHQAQVKMSIQFPDKSLLQYDCGKLQKLAVLLQELKDNGHRALIFTQMTKVLDILELFLSYHGYRYMRLDGATKIEDRQILTERFNTDSRITCFILSTRSGGLGINLTGADTVIFYDSDWNPAMDKQCQDRCHRIGQTRDVHIYRFVSEYTIESNILKKANQKRQLDNVVIQEGDFTTDYFGRLSVSDLLGDQVRADVKPLVTDDNPKNFTAALAQAEDEDDAVAAKVAIREADLDEADFDEVNGTKTNSNSTTPAPAPNANTTLEATEDDIEFDEEDVGHIDEYMIKFISEGYYYD